MNSHWQCIISGLVGVRNCDQWALHVFCVIKKVVLWNRYLWGTILILFSFVNHMKPHDTRGRTFSKAWSFRQIHCFCSVGNTFFFFFYSVPCFSLAGEGFYLIMFLGAVMLNWVSFQRSSHLWDVLLNRCRSYK